MNIFTIVPARGGSKSIPRKNIVLVNGFPLIKYSIDYSLKSALVNKTVVSTDDQEIADIAVDLGADVPFIRPSKLAEDSTEDFPVMFHALKELEIFYKEEIDILILLRPTSPLRPDGLIEEGVALLADNPDATSVRAVTHCQQHPYRQWKKVGKYIDAYDDRTGCEEPYNLPRQSLPPIYFQTGDIEIVRRATILDGSVSGKKVLPLYVNKEQVYDIDEAIDLQNVENALSQRL